jgi:hypothetical protein
VAWSRWPCSRRARRAGRGAAPVAPASSCERGRIRMATRCAWLTRDVRRRRVLVAGYLSPALLQHRTAEPRPRARRSQESSMGTRAPASRCTPAPASEPTAPPPLSLVQNEEGKGREMRLGFLVRLVLL